VSLLWAGLAWGQQTVPPAAAPATPATVSERILSVREGDKPAQRCRVLKTYQTPDGLLAHEVQAIDTGEVMTIVESGSGTAGGEPAGGPRLKGVVTRIFHGRDNVVPSDGSPMPSATVTVESTPPQGTVSTPVKSTVSAPVTPAAPPTPLARRLAQVGPAPATPVEVEAVPATPAPTTKVAVQAAPKTPAPTTAVVTPTAPAAPAPKVSSVVQTVPATQAPMTTATEPSAPSTAAASSADNSWPSHSLFRHLFGSGASHSSAKASADSSSAPTPVATSSTSTAEGKTAAPAPKPADPAPPADWRLSWGQPVDHKSQPVAMMPDLPQAKSQPTDPLNDPRPYSKLPDEYKNSGKPGDGSKVTQTTLASAAGTATPVASGDKSAAPESLGTAPATGSSSSGLLGTLRKVFRPEPPANSTEATAAAAPKAPATAAATPKPAAPRPTGTPLGMASVLAAGDSGQMMVQYVPVPVATLPPLTRMPQPPPPQVPQPPAPFRTPGTAVAGGGAPNADMINAFTSAETLGAQEMTQAASGSTGSNAFSRPNEGSASASGAMAYAGMGRGPAMPQPPYPHQPIGPMAQVMYPQQPYGAMAQSMPYPGTYVSQGPVAMSPYGPGPGGMYGAALGVVAQPTPAAVSQTASAPDFVPQHLTTLRDALYPSHREWAAENLAETNTQVHPEVVDALLRSARHDSAASVRAVCVHSLAKLNARTDAVVTTLRSLKDDSDARVRLEVDQALTTLGSGSPAASQPPVVPAGAVVPAGEK
jgi:hypothetical protein